MDDRRTRPGRAALMQDHWTLYRFWVPDELETSFLAEWQVLAEMLVAEGVMQSVRLLADSEEPRVRWTLLRWPSHSARQAWRADHGHRTVEDAIAGLCDRIRVHRMTSLLTVPSL